MEIEYAQKGGPNQDECWKVQENGEEVLYKRVVAGIAPPNKEEERGGIIVLGERYKSAGFPDFTAFAAQSGGWTRLRQALDQFRQEFKMIRLVTRPDEEDRKVLEDLTRRTWETGQIYMIIVQAPSYALTEIGRQEVDTLISEKRLHLESVKEIFDQAIDPALRCVVTWLLKNKAFYAGPRKPIPGVPWGTTGLD